MGKQLAFRAGWRDRREVWLSSGLGEGPKQSSPDKRGQWRQLVLTCLWVTYVTEPKIALLAARQANKSETRCWGKEHDFIRKAADGEDGGLKSQNNHLIGVWMSVSFIAQRERRWGSKVKRPLSFANITWNGQPRGGAVLISCFLQPSTGGTGSACFPEQRHFGLTFRQRGRVPRGRPLCIDSILLVNKSSGKQSFK